MRKLLTIALMLTLAGAAMAFNLGNQAPVKPAEVSVYNQPAAPVLQGGDTIGTAVAIAIPGTWTGTTVGYTNNYDEVCHYADSTAPDVVYSVTPAQDEVIDIDLCYSSYDTKLYVYDENLNLIGCNDDFYFAAPCYNYSSKLEAVALQAGITYYIVIDGFGAAAGAYQMDIQESVPPCVVTCPYHGQVESEPALVDGYADAWNGGCNSPEFGNPFQWITADVFCGVSGWYFGSTAVEMRDTDWFLIGIPAVGMLEIVGDAEYPTYVFELGPQDCGSVGVIQTMTIGPCESNELYIFGAPGSTVWLWVGPTTFTGPVNEYNYVLRINSPVATENHSWTDVKLLFN